LARKSTSFEIIPEIYWLAHTKAKFHGNPSIKFSEIEGGYGIPNETRIRLKKQGIKENRKPMSQVGCFQEVVTEQIGCSS